MGKEDGFIKISRTLLDWEYSDNLSLTGFWIHLLLHAQWEDSRKLKRGEFYTTQEILAMECNIHRSTVAKYLKMLQKTGQIKVTTDHKRSKVTILKWDQYQMSKKTTSAATTAKTTETTTTKTTAATTYPHKRREEEKNTRKKEEGRASPTLPEIKTFVREEELSIDPERFFQYYEDQNWTRSNGNPVTDWKAAARAWQKTEKPKRQKKQEALPDWYDPNPIRKTDQRPASQEEIDAVMKLALRGAKNK